MRTLFQHADILTMENGSLSVIRNGFLGVSDDRIDYVGAALPADERDYDILRDFTGRTLMPGIVNTHCHSPMTLLRGLGSDLPLQEWLYEHMFPTEDRLRAEDIRAGSYLALLEMLSTGTTSFTDMYYMSDETIDACLEAGIRANISRPVQAFDPNETYENNYRARESLDLFRRRHNDGNGRIKIDFCIHAEYTCNEDVVRRYSEACRENGGRMHIHLSETKAEHDACVQRYGKTPAEWFCSLGTFDSPTAAAHCVWVTDSDIALLAEKGVSVMHNPSSNMKLGSGFAPVEKMLRAGINLALGTDGAASNNNLNMFEELHLASVIHNGFHNDPTVMKPSCTLKMATVNGARLQGRDDTGVLLPGCKADIVAVDMNRPHLYPNPDPMASLCYSAQGSDVVMTMIDGRILYENGEFLTLDAEKIMAEARKSAAYLYGTDR